MFTSADVDMGRVSRQLEVLSRIGQQPTGGITRYTFSPEHLQSTWLAADWMSDAGLQVSFDRWGNLFGTTTVLADQPVVMSGSHLDSVPNGGNYDGVLGVISAIEAVRMITAKQIPLAKGLTVVSFIEEEGARFHGLLGSKLAVGRLSQEEIEGLDDPAGLFFLDVLGDVRFSFPVVDSHNLDSVSSFIELHIEQGKRLEDSGIDIGVVVNIATRASLEVVFTGRADHAGATPYADRLDALLASSEFIVTMRSIGVERFADVGHMTVGKIDVKPNVVNVVPGETTLEIDVRAADSAAAIAMQSAIRQAVSDIAAKHRLQYQIIPPLHKTEPVSVPQHIREAITQGAVQAGLTSRELISWAAHDAMIMAGITDAGMIFVPCRDGRSHSPEEYVNPEAIANGIAALANTLVNLAR